jgi:transposase
MTSKGGLLMILDEESWMNIRRFRALHERGVPLAEIARECRCDWRTVKKYLTQDGLVGPPRAPSRAGTQPRLIDPFVSVVEAWLRADITIKGAVIHERLVTEHGFTGSYQRVKECLAKERPRVAAELAVVDENPLTGLHRRFEVVPGAQAQVDWGEEGDLLGHVGVSAVYAFHMTLSYSRDPFCCYTTSMDLATFWDCHRRAFAYFGGVPGSIVYDRTKTVVKGHVAPGAAVPLHPEAAAFADHYGFVIDVLAAYRPTGKGRVERQVNIVREHVVAGRRFDTLAELDGAFTTWLPIRRAQVHRTHGQVIAARAAVDRAALGVLPDRPYLVAEQHLRRVGKDALISFGASHYSVPAKRIRPGQRVAVRVSTDTLTIHALTVDAGTSDTLLASHRRAKLRGAWVVDPGHWAGLPDGHTRAVTTDPAPQQRAPGTSPVPGSLLTALLARHHADIPVATRPLTHYAAAAAKESLP